MALRITTTRSRKKFHLDLEFPNNRFFQNPDQLLVNRGATSKSPQSSIFQSFGIFKISTLQRNPRFHTFVFAIEKQNKKSSNSQVDVSFSFVKNRWKRVGECHSYCKFITLYFTRMPARKISRMHFFGERHLDVFFGAKHVTERKFVACARSSDFRVDVSSSCDKSL